MLPNTYNSIQYQSFVCIWWSGYTYCYLTLTILFNTSFIRAQSNGFKYCHVIRTTQFWDLVKELQVLLFNTNNSIQNYSFVCTQLNDSKYCYVSLRIQLVISHFFAHILNSSIWLVDRNYQVLPLRARVDLEVMVMKRYSTFSSASGLEPHHEIVISWTLA